jgi:hypothetical protein
MSGKYAIPIVMTPKQRNRRLDAILRAYQDRRLSAQAALDAMRLTLGDRRGYKNREALRWQIRQPLEGEIL